MSDDLTLDEGRHYGVGPVDSIPDHTVIIVSTVWSDDRELGDGTSVHVCLDCGLVTDDRRRFVTEDCDREDNPVPKTVREQGGLRD